MLGKTNWNRAGCRGMAVRERQKHLLGGITALREVTAAALVSVPPLHPACCNDSNVFTDEATDLRSSNAAADAVIFSISPEYLRAAGTTLLAGRDFTWHDDKNAPRVAVLNREFARRIFGSVTNAMGRKSY